MTASTRIPYSPVPTPPGETSPNSMCSNGIPPPSPLKLSCIELTAPVDVPVVLVANNEDPLMPNRCSLPSRFAPASSAAGPFGCASAHHVTASTNVHSRPITDSRT